MGSNGMWSCHSLKPIIHNVVLTRKSHGRRVALATFVRRTICYNSRSGRQTDTVWSRGQWLSSVARNSFADFHRNEKLASCSPRSRMILVKKGEGNGGFLAADRGAVQIGLVFFGGGLSMPDKVAYRTTHFTLSFRLEWMSNDGLISLLNKPRRSGLSYCLSVRWCYYLSASLSCLPESCCHLFIFSSNSGVKQIINSFFRHGNRVADDRRLTGRQSPIGRHAIF